MAGVGMTQTCSVMTVQVPVIDGQASWIIH